MKGQRIFYSIAIGLILIGFFYGQNLPKKVYLFIAVFSLFIAMSELCGNFTDFFILYKIKYFNIYGFISYGLAQIFLAFSIPFSIFTTIGIVENIDGRINELTIMALGMSLLVMWTSDDLASTKKRTQEEDLHNRKDDLIKAQQNYIEELKSEMRVLISGTRTLIAVEEEIKEEKNE